MQQVLTRQSANTGLRLLAGLVLLAYCASAEPVPHSFQSHLQETASSTNQTSLGTQAAVTEVSHSIQLAGAGSDTADAAVDSDQSCLQHCKAPPICDRPVLLEALVPPSADFCPVENLDVESLNESLTPGNKSCAVAVTPSTAAPVEGIDVLPDDTATQQKPPPSDNTEEERHSFALSKDGAKIIASNKEAKKASAILDTDSDTYMKNECKADKWFIIELSQVAKVDAFQLSQYELYSSRVKGFEVRGRQAHPRGQGGDYSKFLNTTGWQLLGRYTAAKTKGSQTFRVAEPAWLKYLQFHFLTHHGSEPICALNDVLVFGKSAAEDLEDQLNDEALLTEAEDSQDSKAAEQPSKATNTDSTSDVPAVQIDATSSSLVDLAVTMNVSSEEDMHGASDVMQAGHNASAGEQKPTRHQPFAEQAAGLYHTGEQNAGQGPSASGSTSQQESAAVGGQAPGRNVSVSLANEALLQTETPRMVDTKADTRTEARPDPSEELLLPHNSAGSTKARHGGSIYDMLLQEIKSLKLQQKQTPRQLAELQRNFSLYMERSAAEMRALDQIVKGLQADLDVMQRVKTHPIENSNTAVATMSDVDVDLRAVLVRLESMQRALHQVQHRVTAIVLLAIIAWLGVVVLTAPALGQLTWILWIPIFLIAAIGVVWLMPIVFRILPTSIDP